MTAGIGSRIKRARERRRWTQRELAAALKVDRKTVDNWENGRTSPRSSIGALEDVLGVSLSGEPEPESVIPPGLLDYIRRTMPPDLAEQAVTALEEALTDSGAVPAAERTDGSSPSRRAG